MTKIQPASFEVVNSQENKTQSQNQVPAPFVKSDTIYNRDDLKSLISLHITTLFSKALEQELTGFVNIRFYKGKDVINEFYSLITIFNKIDDIVDLVIKNRSFNACILPVLCNKEEAKTSNLIGVGAIYFDFDYGDIQANLDKAVSVLGEASFVVKSGGKTENNQYKIHCYWKLDNFITGNQEIKNFFSLKKNFAALIGADENFEKSTQIVRLLGTVNQKYNTFCTLQQANKNIYDTQELLDKMMNYVEANKPLQEKISKSTDNPNQLQYIEKEFEEEKLVSLADVEITLAKYSPSTIIDVFGRFDYDKWRDVIFALSHNFNGDEIGLKLAQDWSLMDDSRSGNEILKSVEIEYKKDRKNHPNPITFKTIIKRANNLKAVLDNTTLVEKYGRPIDIKAINENEKYILTENKLLYTIKKRTGLKIFELCNFIQLLGYGTNIEGQLFLEILTKNFKGDPITSILQQSLKSDELLLRLQDKQLCVDTINFSYLRRYLSIFQGKKEVGILSKSGWDSIDWGTYQDKLENWNQKGSYNLLYIDGVDSYPLLNSGDCVKNYLGFSGVNIKEYLDKKGSFIGWQNNIVKYAVNNDLVGFSLFTAFSAMFYTPLKTRSAIYHFFGESSQGKSVLLDIAMSVMGFAVNEGNPSGYIKWSATENGLEGLCAAKNDMLLCLDELTAVSDPKLIYNAAYMIVNGQGKVRASSRGTGYGNRVTKNWKTTAISTGEVPLRQKLEESGQEVMGGQEARFLDIPSVMDIFGVFNELHGFKTSYDLVKHFEEQSANYKGFAIKEFLKYVTINNKFSDILKEFRRLKTLWLDSYFETITDINTNQLKSVADNFAFVAAAGELAIKGGIFADYFKEWDAFKIVNNIFRRYLENLGDYTVTSEERKIVRNLKEFLRQKIAVAFWERPNETPFNSNMITKSDSQGWFGYKEKSEFYLLIDRAVEICGFNAEKVFDVLKKKKLIVKDKNVKVDKPSSYKHRLRFRPYGEDSRPYFYLLDLKALGMVDYLTDDNFPEPPTNNPSTDKLKDLSCETTSLDNPSNSMEASTNPDSSNSSSNSSILPRNNLLSLLNSLDATTLYSIGVTMRSIEPNLGILTDYEPMTLHIFELIKNEMLVVEIGTEPFTLEEQESFRKLKLVTNSFNNLIKVLPTYMLENIDSSLLAYACSDEKKGFFTLSIFNKNYTSLREIESKYDNFKAQLKQDLEEWKLYQDFDKEEYVERKLEYFPTIKNYVMRSRQDFGGFAASCFQQYVYFACIVEGNEKKPSNIRYLVFKKSSDKPIVIKFDNGLNQEEQLFLKPLDLVFSKANLDTNHYFPNLNYDWVHFIDLALLTRDANTNLTKSLKEPFYLLKDDTDLEELLSTISTDLKNNHNLWSRIEPEVLNESAYRNAIDIAYTVEHY